MTGLKRCSGNTNRRIRFPVAITAEYLHEIQYQSPLSKTTNPIALKLTGFSEDCRQRRKIYMFLLPPIWTLHGQRVATDLHLFVQRIHAVTTQCTFTERD